MYVSNLLQHSDVYVVFDHYFEKSLKLDTRLQIIGSFQRSHQLSIETSPPSKEVCMSSFKTKWNLIQIIAKFLLQRFSSARCQHKLIVTSKSIYPAETNQGLQINRQHLMTVFDEADYIIPQQVNVVVEHGQTAIKVIFADAMFSCFCVECAWRKTGLGLRFTWIVSIQIKQGSVFVRQLSGTETLFLL